MVGIAMEISDRKRQEANTAFLLEISDDFMQLSSEVEMMQTIGAKMGAFLQLSSYSFVDIDESCHELTIRSTWNAPDVPALVGPYPLFDYATEDFVRASRAREIYVIDDAQNDWRTNAQSCAAVHIGAWIVIPYHREGEWKGYFLATATQPRAWTEAEIGLIREVSYRMFPRLERAHAEAALRERETLISGILGSITDGFLVLDREWRYTFFNDHFLRQANRSAAQLLGQVAWEVFPELVNHDIAPLLHRAMQERISVDYEFYYEPLQMWISDRAYPTRDGGLAIYSRDITECKRMEEQLRKSLMEKELLLQEIHHRVKNNLQIIISLLRMQARKSGHEQRLDVLQEAQNRVQSMALIHEQLYRLPDLSNIVFEDYLRGLIRHLFQAYGISFSRVVPQIQTNAVTLPIDLAIPCGLITNELITNVLKYAFPDLQTGELQIQMRPDHIRDTDVADIVLTIADNGIGIPESISLETVESFGLTMVKSLTKQLGGTLSLDRSQGTCFHIRFPCPT